VKNPAQIAEELAGHVAFARAKGRAVSLDLDAWLSQHRQATRSIVFRPSELRVGAFTEWLVGPPDDLVAFLTECTGVRALHILAAKKTVSLDLLRDTDAYPADKKRAADAVRASLKRGVKELRKHCPALGNELSTFKIIEEHLVCYRRSPSGPAIETGHVGQA
jgi:hypothetical protein